MTEASSRGPLISFVTVTYGTGPVVIDAIRAIDATVTVDHEIIVVDNPPDDDRPRSASLLHATPGLGHITVIEPDRNLGFAAGNNLGAERARGDFVGIINPDVVVGPGWIEPLLTALDDPLVGIAAPVLVNPDGTLQEAGQLLYDDACTAAIGGPEIRPGDWSQAFTRDVDYASAACWLVRRDEFFARGGFDERYHPAYFEDVDYALRVEADGQRTRLVADVPVVHHHGEGGAFRDLATGQQAQATFRSIWAGRFVEHPPRPADDAEALVNRDRLAASTIAWSAPTAHSTPAARAAALADAVDLARRAPRDRVMYLTDDTGDLDVDGARAAGVDVVIGDVEQATAERSDLVDDWHAVGTPPPEGVRPALRALLSPWTLLVGVVGVVARSLILRSPSGVLNSDEAYTGLAAMGVLDGRFPIVLDGNRYTAVIEAYLFAPVTAAIGPSILALKIVPMVMWAIAAILAYLAGDYLAAGLSDDRRIGRRVGAVTGALVWIAPGAMLVVSTLAYPAYALGMAVCVATLVAAARVIDRDTPGVRSSVVLGALTGLGFYLHPMFLAVLVPITVPVAWVHRRAAREFWAPFLIGGIVVNGPFLLWNIVNGFPSLDVQNALPGTYTDRLSTFGRELVPRGYGLRDVSFDWVLGLALGIAAYVALVGLAIVGCVGLIRGSARRSRFLLPIVLVAVWPLMALFSPLIWSADGRYNIISFPFVVLAAASALAVVPVRGRWLTGAAVSFVVLWSAVYVWPHTDDVIGSERIDANASSYAVVDYLETAGIDRIAGSYWRVLTVEYLSDREIIGAVTWPGAIRFPERQRDVQASPPEEVAFVFPTWADEPGLLWMPPDEYERVVVGDTVVYVPATES